VSEEPLYVLTDHEQSGAAYHLMYWILLFGNRVKLLKLILRDMYTNLKFGLMARYISFVQSSN